jgi:hypothetical protein
MPFAAEIQKKKKPNYFDNYSGFADSRALSVQGGGKINFPLKEEILICKDRFLVVSRSKEFFDEMSSFVSTGGVRGGIDRLGGAGAGGGDHN